MANVPWGALPCPVGDVPFGIHQVPRRDKVVNLTFRRLKVM
jgi:hypothetical protein